MQTGDALCIMYAPETVPHLKYRNSSHCAIGTVCLPLLVLGTPHTLVDGARQGLSLSFVFPHPQALNSFQFPNTSTGSPDSGAKPQSGACMRDQGQRLPAGQSFPLMPRRLRAVFGLGVHHMHRMVARFSGAWPGLQWPADVMKFHVSAFEGRVQIVVLGGG